MVRDGDKASAWRVKDNKLQKVPLALAERDARSGDYVVKSGLAEGDQVIRYPTALLKDNQPVQTAARRQVGDGRVAAAPPNEEGITRCSFPTSASSGRSRRSSSSSR